MAKKQEETLFKTSIGGQALMEGILMRGPEKQAIVCRKSDGTLAIKTEPVNSLRQKYKFFGLPFIRGTVTLIESLVKGMNALTYSADLLPEDEQEKDKLDEWIEKKFGPEHANDIIIAVAVVLGVALAVGLFVLLPALLFELLPDSLSLVVRCLLEGVIRIIIFLVYLGLCTRVKEVARVFEYHGAEHKTIFCYEKGLELTVDNVRVQSRLHPRCGTSFLVVVMLVSILVVSVMTWVLSLIPGMAAMPKLGAALIRVLAKLLMLPVTVGVTYEINRWVGRHDGENWLAIALAWPGKQSQRLTTREPDDGMMECAIEALKLVLPEVEGSDRW